MVQSALVVSLRAFASIILFLKKVYISSLSCFYLSIFKSMLPLRAVAFSPQRATVSWGMKRYKRETDVSVILLFLGKLRLSQV